MFNACMYLHAMYVRYGVYVNHSAMWVQICGSAMYGAIRNITVIGKKVFSYSILLKVLKKQMFFGIIKITGEIMILV